jgi:hypothetical protein
MNSRDGTCADYIYNNVKTDEENKMKTPEYVSKTEVQRVCQELGLMDWTKIKEPVIPLEDAAIIQKEIGAEAIQTSAEEFKLGLEVELEHGIQFPDANVTNNHPILTGMIVLAHLKEMLDYYARLEVAELEGDLLKVLLSGDQAKLARKYKQLLEAKVTLSELEKEAIIKLG